MKGSLVPNVLYFFRFIFFIRPIRFVDFWKKWYTINYIFFCSSFIFSNDRKRNRGEILERMQFGLNLNWN